MRNLSLKGSFPSQAGEFPSLMEVSLFDSPPLMGVFSSSLSLDGNLTFFPPLIGASLPPPPLIGVFLFPSPPLMGGD